MTLPLNQIVLGNCVDTMKTFPADSIDLTVTSPPYDGLRKYNGYCFDFPAVASELYRITKPGGVVVWNVNDQTIEGSESLTSFKQAIYFVEESAKSSYASGAIPGSGGFRLHDTMIWEKPNPITFGIDDAVRYLPSFEYMFVFSKGQPNTFNPLTAKTKTGGKQYTSVKVMGISGKPTRVDVDPKTTNDKKLMSNIWNTLKFDPEKLRTHILEILDPKPKVIKQSEAEKLIDIENKNKSTSEKLIDIIELLTGPCELKNTWNIPTATVSGNHPAIFPQKLVEGHIKSWTNPGDIVFDCFMGSGTTAVSALMLKRNFVGCEISEEYRNDAIARINMVGNPGLLKLKKIKDESATAPDNNFLG